MAEPSDSSVKQGTPPTGKNGKATVSCVRIQKASELLQVRRLQSKAATYSPTVTQYHQRDKA